MTQPETTFSNKNAAKYECLKCGFICSKNSDWERHILTQKHQRDTNDTNDTKTPVKKSEKLAYQKTANPGYYKCCCGLELKSRSTIWRHKKKCHPKIEVNEKEKDNQNADKEIIKMLIKENSEFKNMILDIVKTFQPNANTNNNNTNNNNNSHNTTNNNNNFNLQFFLNDTCKDAINLADFVESLQVKLKDLEETARLGYSQGVSNIFINGLNELEVNKRPIHCSDAKRETLYIKEQNKWIKEDPVKSHITKAIKTVDKKNIQQIFEWQKKYPEYRDPKSKQNDKYLNMIHNAMNGSTNEEQEKNMEKIIKNIAKEVIIDKN